jgi:type I restriction enzyme S subunit
MQSPQISSWLQQHSTGSTMASLNQDILLRVPLSLPTLDEQHEVADILAALDDRVTLLNDMNTTLESVAQAIFKSWFIDFDPVRAKAEGREPEGMDAETAALFPSEFEESELGPIPKGWRIEELKSLCDRIANGATPSRRNPDFWTNGHLPWFKTGELLDGFLLEPSERITQAAVTGSSVKVFPKHAVLMAIYAAPTVGRLGILTEEAAFNQACTGLVPLPEIGAWFLFQTLLHGRNWFNSRANGAAQQNISKAIVESYPCVLPPLCVLRAFNSVAESIYGAIESNSLKEATLTQLRDTLLPRLISGKLRIPEAQEVVEEALA